MNRAMIAILLVLSLVLFARPSYALMKMDDNGINDALEYGNTHPLEEIVNAPEWTIKAKDFTEVTLMTPYNLVAVKAAKAKMDGKELTFEEAKAMFKVTQEGTSVLDYLPFYCMVYGATEDYLKELAFELRQGTNVVKPGDAEMEPATLHEKDGRKIYFTNYRLYFRVATIDIKSPITFVVTNPLGKTMEYEFDLGKIR